ncbi:MAG: tandem-95 repeat protein [Candidatus Magnetomorum sp.]|nr:tandem-95 repeat protein [Candidatus Magnetomorum sp.]
MKQKIYQTTIFFLLFSLWLTCSLSAELIEGFAQYPASDPVVTITNPEHLSVCYYREAIPINIPKPGPVVQIQFKGNEPDVQAVFDQAAVGKTIYFRFNQTVKAYTVPVNDDTFDWQTAETWASITDWEAPAGYYQMPSGSPAVSLINPMLYEVSFFHEDVEITLPTPGSVVSIDITGNTAADIQLVCDAAMTGKQMYIKFNDIIKAYTLPDSAETNDAFSWIDAPEFNVDSLTNRPPQISSISDVFSNEDEPYTIYFTVTDPDNDAITLTITSSDRELLPDDHIIHHYTGNDNSIYLMPSPNLSGQTTITIIASDGEKSVTQQFEFTVAPVNDPPEIGNIVHQYLNEDEPHSLTVILSDIDTLENIQLTAEAINKGLIPDGQLSISKNVIQFTPAKDQFGETVMTVTAIDGNHEVSISFDVTVISVNDPPSFEVMPMSIASNLGGGIFVKDFAYNISSGASNEDQSLVFEVSTDNEGLFFYTPTIDNYGQLFYFPEEYIDSPSETICNVTLKELNADNDNNMVSVTKQFKIQIKPSKAIIVAASSFFDINNYSLDSTWDEINFCAEYGYDILLKRGYNASNISYITPLSATSYAQMKDLISSKIKNWAKGAYELVLYMVGHGSIGYYQIGSETLTIGEIDSYLSVIEENIPGHSIIIYEACHSGSFIDKSYSKKKRIILTSSTYDEPSVILNSGRYTFSFQFWANIIHGINIYDSFLYASHIINKFQTPIFDANGNADFNEIDDIVLAKNIIIGSTAKHLSTDEVIDYVDFEVSENIDLRGETSVEIDAKILFSTNKIDRVIAVILPPDHCTYTKVDEYELIMNEDNSSIYNTQIDNLDQIGIYEVLVYTVIGSSDEGLTETWSSPETILIEQHGYSPDIYESNNNLLQAAMPLDLENTRLNFHEQNDEDWFVFYGNESESYEISTINTGVNTKINLTLYDYLQQQIISATSDSCSDDLSLNFYCMADGEYYLKISSASPITTTAGTGYELVISNNQEKDLYEDDSFENARTIEITNMPPQYHNFHCYGDKDWVKFYAISDAMYTFKTNNAGQRCNTIITLFDSQKKIIKSVNEHLSGENESFEWEFDKEGIYYVCVQQFDPGIYGNDTGYYLYVLIPNAIPLGKLNGHIKEYGTNNIIVNAIIKILQSSITALSHPSGIFRMRHDPGMYTLIVEATGYEQMSIPNVEIKEFSTTRQDFQLTPKMFTITLQKAGNGNGNLPFDSKTVNYGESLTLSQAIPDSNSTFVGYSGDTQNLDFIDENKTIIATFSLNNTPPVISSISTKTSKEDETASFSVSITDNTPDSLYLSIVSSNTDLLSMISGDQTEKKITYTPNPDQFGSTILTICVTDSEYTATTSVDITILPVNDPPSFKLTKTKVECVNFSTENVFPGFATAISAGSENENQQVSFIVSSDKPQLFVSQPQIDSVGSLYFTPSNKTTGSAKLSVFLQDDGTVDNGGSNQSEKQHFTIEITQGYVVLSGMITEKDSTTPIANAQITCISIDQPFFSNNEGIYQIKLIPGTYNLTVDAVGFETNTQTIVIENGTTVTRNFQLNPKTFVITLLQTGAGSGTLPFDQKEVRFGESLSLQAPKPDEHSIFTGWSGDIEGLGLIDENKTITATFSLKNTPPIISCMSTITSKEDESGTLSVTITDNETVEISVSSSNTDLLPNDQIIINGDETEKTITYTPVSNEFGDTRLTISATDGEYTATNSVDVTILSVNDPPVFVIPDTMIECSNIAGNYDFPNFATEISAGPANENQEISFAVTSDNMDRFDSPPEIDSNGNLFFLPHDYAIGTFSMKVILKDNDSTENGGENTCEQTFSINVMPSKAIILGASSKENYDNDDLWTDIFRKTNDAYATFIGRSYKPEYINYLSSANMVLNVDDLATKNNFKKAITDCQDAYDLVIYMVGHGGDGYYTINHTERIDAIELDSLLDDLQDKIPGKVVLIYDAPLSGSFMSTMTAPAGSQRIVITSTSDDQINYSLYNGDISFSFSFWNAIQQCGAIDFAFNTARSHMLPFQSAMIDANGNGIANETEDIQRASVNTIGSNIIIPSDKPYIENNAQIKILQGETNDTISAGPVTASNPPVHVIGMMIRPDDGISDEIKTITDLEIIEFSDPDQDNIFTYDYTAFTQQGTYMVHVYAKNIESQYSEPVSLTYIQDVEIFSITILKAGDGNGTLSFENQSIKKGGIFQYPTYVPDDCSKFDGWSGDAQGLDNIQSDKTIIATFSLKSFILNPIKSPYGIITPSESEIAECGSSQTYTITADEGYHISDVIINDISIGAVQTYIFNDIKQAYRIKAIFDNAPPWISIIPDQCIDEDTALDPIPFTIVDLEDTIPDTITVTSSNQCLVAIDNIVISGNFEQKTIALSPVHNMFGTTTITIEGIDRHGLSTRRSFLLEVIPIADPGDINNDGVVDMIDLILTLKALANFNHVND